MREGWKEYRLGELVDLKQGFALNKKSNHYLSNNNNGLPLLKISDLINNSETLFVKENIPKQFIVTPTEIIYSRTGQVGLAFMGKTGVVYNNCFKVIPTEKVYSVFIYQWLNNPVVRREISSLATGAAQPDLNHDAFKSVKINLPPLPTQRKIASILSAYDDLIENNLKRIKLLEEKAQLTYEEWFVRMKFPGHETVKVDVESGLPEGWRSGTLADLVDYQSGFAFKSSKFKEDGFPVIKIKNIGNNTIDTTNTVFIDEEYAKQASKFKLKPGDLLIAMTGATIGKVGIMTVTEKPCFLNQRVGRFLRKNVLDNTAFVNCLFTIGQGLNHVMNIAGGAAQPNISASQILSIETIIPDEEILIIFSELTTNSNNTILKLLNQNRLLKEARDILLPRLMSGMVDVGTLI